MDCGRATEPARRVRAAPAALRILLEAFGLAREEEPCGVLLGRRDGREVRVQEARRLRNAHPSPRAAYLLTPEDLLEARRVAAAAGHDVVGLWHGHLVGGPWPGHGDAASLTDPLGPGLLLIVGRGSGAVRVIRAFVSRAGGIAEVPLAT